MRMDIKKLAHLPVGRWIVLVAQAVAVLVLGQRLWAGDSLYGALWKCGTIDLLAMAIGGIAERFWEGAKVKSASAAGTGIDFEQKTRRFGFATRRSLQLLEDSLNEQMLALAERVLAVEKTVADLEQRAQDVSK